MIRFVRPSRGHITQPYANRQPDGNPHAGQDYAYSNGREIFPEVYAAAKGKVLFAGDSRGLAWPNIMYVNIDFDRSDNQDSSAGNYTIIQHYENGVPVALTGYGHQEEVWVKAGQWVGAGQRIGTVGATGFSFGKHLHFDLVLFPFDVDDAPFYGRVDPNPYISGLSYVGSVTQSGTTTTQEDDMAADTPFTSKDGSPVTLEQLLNSIDGKVDSIPSINADFRGEFDKLRALDADVRGDLANKGQQLSALTAANSRLVELLASSKELSVDDVRAALTAAIAEGIKVTVEVK